MKTRRSWEEKLRPAQQAYTTEDPRGRGLMLIPTPMLVASEIAGVRRGHTVTPDHIRDRLAQQHGAAFTCPLTTGIFFSIVAGAVEDQLARGEAPLAPYWLVVPRNGLLNPKWPPGTERQAEHLRAEGHSVEHTQRGWRLVSGTQPTKRRRAGSA